MYYHLPGVLERIAPEPSSKTVPVIFDSPHSGSIYPDDFNHALTTDVVRRAEDAFVHDLYGAAPEHGAVLLHALFPRSYIDPNRRANDIDESLLSESWPGGAKPGPKAKWGIGLIRKKDPHGVYYNRQLTVAEIQQRLQAYYEPYHQTLAATFDYIHQRFQQVWHINCHSMRDRPATVDNPWPDFCVGDRDGTTCDPAFTNLVVETLREMGYRVAVNKPYKGVELVKRYSDPSNHKHSLQIEVCRALYMDELAVKPHAGFAKLQRDINVLIRKICHFCSLF